MFPLVSSPLELGELTLMAEHWESRIYVLNLLNSSKSTTVSLASLDPSVYSSMPSRWLNLPVPFYLDKLSKTF